MCYRRDVEKTRAIGVFDSGLGGLSVLRALRERLPHENFVYLGDVARLPYGTKSAQVVSKYAGRCVEHLLQYEMKAIVIACNTATATALDWLKEVSPVPVFGVIRPGVRAALQAPQSRRILVAATASTVKSGSYLKGFAEVSPGAEVLQVACPLLVPLAEEGWFESPTTRDIISHYLTPFLSQEIDVCLLGCTHYPLLKKSFEAVLGEKVSVVHGGEELAKELEAYLIDKGLSADRAEKGGCRFLSTDVVSTNSPILDSLFGSGSRFEAVDL
jgi:glutamate racemase